MMPNLPRLAILVVVSILPLSAGAENWPQWRGPAGDGVSRETELPVVWSDNSGLLWKCKLPEWGDSTPAVWGNAVFLTSHVDDQRLVLLRIHKKTGQIEWTQEVGTARTPRASELRKSGDQRRHTKFHADHNLATPSPVTDGQLVVVHFGNGDLAAYDFDGKQLWSRNLQKDYGDYTIWWGHANSPMLCGDLVISVCMQDSCADLPGSPSPSYVVAHDKHTGKEKWMTPRKTAATAESCDSYVTPILWRNGQRLEMVVWGGQMLDAYDPATGEQTWYLPNLTGNRVIPGPVAANGMLFATQGMRKALLAVKPGGPGQRSRKDIVWSYDQGTSDSPTPVVWDESLFMISNDGVARCLDALTGRMYWKERLKGQYRASPVAAEGRIYFLNMEGLTTVVSASRRFDRLTENRLSDKTLASPAISDGKLLIRGRSGLYCASK